jgi:hypothetical protein
MKKLYAAITDKEPQNPKCHHSKKNIPYYLPEQKKMSVHV